MTPKLWERVEVLLRSVLERAARGLRLFRDPHAESGPRPSDPGRVTKAHEQPGDIAEHPPSAPRTMPNEAVSTWSVGIGQAGQAPVPGVDPAPERPRTFSVGGVVAGRYRIARVVGQGAMGDVYDVEDLELHVHVALKTLRREILASDPRAVERLKSEIRLARRVTHPNVCRIHDLGEDDGAPGAGAGASVPSLFLTMELLTGETLEDRIGQARRLTTDEALGLVSQIAAGLDAVHAAGVLHRDFKSRNVMLVPDPQHGTRAVVVDFGLAHFAAPGGLASVSDSISIAGTPAYMAPEQVRGDRLTPAADIYALGVVMYEMVTGVRPFQGGGTMSIALRRLTDAPPSPRIHVPALDPVWEAVILRCLEREPAARFQKASDVVRALRGEDRKPWRTGWGWMAAAALSVLAVAVTQYPRRPPPLTERDTIVLGDFTNKTGDSVFDDALKQGLAVELEQSPFLNLVSQEDVAATLKLMGRTPGDRLTQEVGREVCQRVGSKAVVEGSIATLGQQYLIALNAVDCTTGQALARAQVQAARKEEVVGMLGKAGSSLRGKLGESLASIGRFGIPLEEATTGSLEALKVWSVAKRVVREKGDAAIIPFARRAVELDPNFALAHVGLAIAYYNLGQADQARESSEKAYELRERTSEREKAHISAFHYVFVTGELEKAMQTFSLAAQIYPRESTSHTNLTAIYMMFGQWEKAESEALVAQRLEPENLNHYGNLGLIHLALGHLAEAKATVGDASARKRDGATLRQVLYQAAFLEGERTEMEQQLHWSFGRPGDEDVMMALQADTEAYYGRLGAAREWSQRAVDSAVRAGSRETAAWWKALAALHEVELGNPAEAKRAATAALELAAGRELKTLAALAFARAGDTSHARALAAELAKDFPLSTLLNAYWLPVIRAAGEIDRNPSRAVELLETVTPYELGSPPPMNSLYPIFVRGEAYLRMQRGQEAAVEFQKILGHPGIVLNCVLGALARLGLARAYQLSGDADKARAAYLDLFTVWKDADPALPVLRQARAEYARLNDARSDVPATRARM